MNTCKGCGAPSGEDTPQPGPSHCGQCPPTPCDDCGGVNVWSTGDLCACWTDVTALAPADLKALFADDCGVLGLSVDVEVTP